MSQRMSFYGMRISDAILKAHEAFPNISYYWPMGLIVGVNCGCSAALLTYAVGSGACWNVLNAQFPLLEEKLRAHPKYRMTVMPVGVFISDMTVGAGSFEEAAELLREKGY